MWDPNELRRARRFAGLTQAQAAAENGTTASQWSRWESGARTPHRAQRDTLTQWVRRVTAPDVAALAERADAIADRAAVAAATMAEVADDARWIADQLRRISRGE